MKKLIFLTGISLLLLSAKCNKKFGFKLGEPFELKMGVTMPCSDCDDLSVQFISVKEDSRCPEFTNCIWEGQAVIEFNLISKQTITIDLIERKGHPEMSRKVYGDYSYTLLKVDPYPKSGSQIMDEDYILEMKVERVKS
jgi:hypothetical protein